MDMTELRLQPSGFDRGEGRGTVSTVHAHVLGIRLRRLQALLGGHWSRWFKGMGVGVTPLQGGVLLLINENPGINQATLGRLLKIEPPSLHQALRPLVDAGLVRRHQSLEDKRALAVYLTKAGHDLTDMLVTEAAAHEADLLGRLSAEERDQLLALLDKAIASGEEAVRVLSAP
ncbi:MAG: MarR family winged helix-turn-helix transcriptional regulator [Bauldia sp.]